jgi:hypothetical protein
MPKTSKKSSTRAAKSPKKQSAKAGAPKLPGYLRFTRDVSTRLVENGHVFGRLVLLAFVVLLLLLGTSQYTYYTDLTQSTDDVAGQLTDGAGRTAVEVAALFVSVTGGAGTASLTESQQIFTGFTYLVLWLVVVWLLRHLLSGNAVRVRDGLYNGTSPLVSTVLVALAGLVQLLPFALIVALVAAAASTGAVAGIGWGLLGLVLVVVFGALSLYWLAGTVFAAVVVTLPGTYPWAALKSAKQVIAGYRGKVILRLLWLLLVLSVMTLITILPAILLDAITGYNISVLVTFVTLFMNAVLFVYGSAYVYLLYREVIDDRG